MWRFRAKDAREHGVESAHPQVASVASHHALDPLAHFLRRLVREGQRHDAERIDVLALDKMCDAEGQHARLPRSRSRDEHTRPFRIYHPFPLWLIQTF